MAILIPPEPDTIVIRRPKTQFSDAGHWHILKSNKSRKVNCGEVVELIDQTELSSLGAIRARDLCSKCWMFGKGDEVKILEGEQLALF